eukprot:scaffold21677_cov19-Tisochrysis_lutea.AAC.1
MFSYHGNRSILPKQNFLKFLLQPGLPCRQAQLCTSPFPFLISQPLHVGEKVAALGNWSRMAADTPFAIGSGPCRSKDVNCRVE